MSGNFQLKYVGNGRGRGILQVIDSAGSILYLDKIDLRDSSERARAVGYIAALTRDSPEHIEAECLRLASEHIAEKEEKKGFALQGRELVVSWPEPWDGDVSLAECLDEFLATLQRHIVMGIAEAYAATLWVGWAWLYDFYPIAPILAICSPVKRCGKTSLLRLIAAVAPKPLMASSVSPAALFRVAERLKPCILLDEIDAQLPGNEDLRLILNGGFTRDSCFIIRCCGESFEPRAFDVYVPKVVAGIGKLPPTIADRAIIINLQRKRPGDPVKPVTWDVIEGLKPLARKFFRCRLTLSERAEREGWGTCWPLSEPPSGLDDRAADIWAILLAVADLASGHWSDRGRWAAEDLGTQREEEEISINLLRDCLRVFGGEAYLPTRELIRRLVDLEESPWGSCLRGRPINPRKLAAWLKPFGITPRKWEACNGYLLEDFRRVAEAYIPAECS